MRAGLIPKSCGHSEESVTSEGAVKGEPGAIRHPDGVPRRKEDSEIVGFGET